MNRLLFFTARRYASAVYAVVILCLSVHSSIQLTQDSLGYRVALLARS